MRWLTDMSMGKRIRMYFVLFAFGISITALCYGVVTSNPYAIALWAAYFVDTIRDFVVTLREGHQRPVVDEDSPFKYWVRMSLCGLSVVSFFLCLWVIFGGRQPDDVHHGRWGHVILGILLCIRLPSHARGWYKDARQAIKLRNKPTQNDSPAEMNHE